MLCNDGGEWHIQSTVNLGPYFQVGDLAVVIEDLNILVYPGKGSYPITDFLYFDTNLYYHLNAFLEKCFQCDLCKKIFKNKERATQHIIESHSKPALNKRRMRSGSTNETFKCSLCNKDFKGKNPARQHVIDKHPQIVNYEKEKMASKDYTRELYERVDKLISLKQ